ncbi:MAG: hypothetical protein ABIH20_01850 [Candidatus Diapherotrites archaeon]
MNKKEVFMNKLYIFLILGISVFLLGCAQPPPVTITQYVCSNGTVVTDQALCPVAEVAEVVEAVELTLEQELEVCIGMPVIQQASLEDMCIIGIAGKYEDVSLCKKVSRDSRPGCYGIIAGVKGDPDLCFEAAPEEDQCYQQYAQNKMDGSVCGKIKNINTKDNCYNNLANQLGEATLCGEMQNLNQKDNCYLDMARRFNDPSYCDNITNSDQKQNCLQSTQGK